MNNTELTPSLTTASVCAAGISLAIGKSMAVGGISSHLPSRSVCSFSLLVCCLPYGNSQ